MVKRFLRAESSFCGEPDREECPNIIVMSDAGKPVFSRFGNDTFLSKMCGLVQAVRTSVNDARASDLGEIQSLTTNHMCVVFMTVGSITLVAISKHRSSRDSETEIYLRLQLEYIYSQIIFSLTEEIQSVYIQNPNYDLTEVLGASDTIMNGILDEASPAGNVGPYMLGSIETIAPISDDLRDMASDSLLMLCNKTPNAIFALLLSGDKILSIVQPSYVPHQLTSSDLRILIHFITSQPGLLTSELWFPVCLPRFNSKGFLYAYSKCLDNITNLSVILVSQINTTDQFEHFRKASTWLRKELGLPNEVGSVLKITEDRHSIQASKFDDVAWKRVSKRHDAPPRHNLIGSKMPNSGPGISDDEGAEYRKALPTRLESSPQHSSQSMFRFDQNALLKELELACDPDFLNDCSEKYKSTAECLHFVFRKNFPVGKQDTKEQGGILSQVYSPPIGFPFIDTNSKRRIWSMYQRLSLRMRLGSGSMPLNELLEVYGKDAADEKDEGYQGIPRSACCAMAIAESVPDVKGLTYVMDGLELFLAMNGRDFEM